MPDVGDYTTPSLTVYPFDGTTDVTLTVIPPGDAASLTPVVDLPTEVDITIDGVPVTAQRWTTAAVRFTVEGWWTFAWSVTGVGAGSEFERIHVLPPPQWPAEWAPDRERVASYIPQRSIVGAANGYGNTTDTFGPTTHPTGAQVDNLIADAMSWVLLKTGTVADALTGAATATAAVYAAAMIERAYPDASRDSDIAAQLYAQAVAMRADLAAANETATGTDSPGDEDSDLLPLYSFPAAPAWGDYELL